jgi:hypothetical protein
MKCPHCLTDFHDVWKEVGQYDNNRHEVIFVTATTCPACSNAVFYIKKALKRTGQGPTFMVYPKGISRAPVPNEVPPKFADDYKEACLVLADSPKASAALSRRCLQNILREIAKVPPGDLYSEIDSILKSNLLPGQLAGAIDAVRQIGNFAAHPVKSKTTGDIVEVEPGEAEWSLDVLEGLFDYYFVQPSQIQKKRETLNKKLAEMGKPPLK